LSDDRYVLPSPAGNGIVESRQTGGLLLLRGWLPWRLHFSRDCSIEQQSDKLRSAHEGLDLKSNRLKGKRVMSKGLVRLRRRVLTPFSPY